MLAGMDDVPSAEQLRGAVLRAWREHADVRSGELAERMGKAPQTLSGWESGARAHRGLDPYEIAEALGTSVAETEAFVDLWRAAGSVTDGMPHTRWAHNFAAPGGPVWVWLRPSAGASRLRAALWWGEPFQGSLDIEVSASGIVLTAPVSIPNPPLEVVFEGDGWADFGTGLIPEEVGDGLGALVRDGRSILGTSAPAYPPIRDREQRALGSLFGSLRTVAEDLGIAWSVLVPHLGMARSDRAPHSLQGHTVGSESTSGPRVFDDRGVLRSQLLLSGAQARDLREARGFSRQHAATEASAHDREHPVSHSAVETLEASGSTGKTHGLLSRLDTVYGADGRLGVERTFDSLDAPRPARPADGYVVNFPRYWVGPVWLQAVSPVPGGRDVVDLVWGPWRRKQRVDSGCVLTTRRATKTAEGLQVVVPAGWRLIAGVGASPSALDVGHGWWPVNLRAAARLLRENLELVRGGASRVGESRRRRSRRSF